MKKTIRLMLVLALLFANVVFNCSVFADDSDDEAPVNINDSQITSTSDGQPPRIAASSAIVMDFASGRILYEKNAYVRRSIASTTKIMTAIVAIENGNFEDDVVISKRSAAIGGSTVGLKQGRTYKLKDLMYAMMLRSGNDAAIAIAEHIGGSVEAFAQMMNRKAAEIGALNTNFVTPHGLDDPQHYSTAYDLALITQYALKNPIFAEIVATKSSTFEGRGINNTNEMLSLYPGTDGVKTGYTGQAGRCLVTSVSQNGNRYISVVLNCASRTQRAANSKSILDYSFANYKNYDYLFEGQQVAELKLHKGIKGKLNVYAGSTITLPLKEDERERIKVNVDIPNTVEAPIRADSKVGSIKYELDGQILAKSDIFAKDNINRKDFYFYFRKIFVSWGNLIHS